MISTMIHWNVDPALISIGSLEIRWYGALFACAFLLGREILDRISRAEKWPLPSLDSLFVYMVIGTVVGARLGHTLFYEPQIYLRDPVRILKVWEGGLASHGAAIGIVLALWVFSKRNPVIRFAPLLDRVSVPVALAGFLIRLGNLFNSEIIGKPTGGSWGFVFARIDEVPRHPAQLYESITYLIIFVLLYRAYWKSRLKDLPGALFGILLVLVFSARFAIEFLKENQEAFEASLPLNLGQLLSLPLIVIGLVLVMRALSASRARLHRP